MTAIAELSPGALLAAWRHRLVETVRPLFAEADSVALLDFPEYANVGDSALWLGAVELCRTLGRQPAYVAGASTYHSGVLRSRMGRRPVVCLLGGGNLGDLWPRRQAFRERVLLDFPDWQVVQLPQSIHFRDRGAVERARRILAGHPRFTLVVRTARDQDLARAELGMDALLTPDLAFALPALRRPVRPDMDILWLSREDQEVAGDRPHGQGLMPFDWPPDRPGVAALALQQVLRYPRRAWGLMPALVRRLHDRVAWDRLVTGLRLLARGRVVVTNRLHGHLLSLLLGIPHFLSDNSYGKLSSYFDTWTHLSPLASWQDSEAAALAAARRHVASVRKGAEP